MVRKPSEFIGFPQELDDSSDPWVFNAIARWDARYDDGDTMWFLIDEGFNDYTFKSIRLEGIDAPELRGIRASVGAAPAREHLFHLLPYNAPCVLYTNKDPEGRGRYIAAVFALHHEQVVCVNVEMVRSGHAIIKEEWGWSTTLESCIRRGVDVSDYVTMEGPDGGDSAQPE